MDSDLERQITGLKPGQHLCLIYEDAAEQMAAIVPFVKTGLAQGECCVYIADDFTSAEVVAALIAAGVDVPRERERGALVLLTKRETYLRGGRFEPEAMIALLRQAQEEALAAGFTGLRATGEVTWALGPEAGCDRLIEYEARLNTFLPGARALAICQYQRRRFAPALLREVLRTHPVAILGDQVCPNLYYESPELMLGQASEAERVDGMIANLQRMRTAERALRESEARYRTLFENSGDGIYICAREGQVIDVNRAALDLFGYSRDELIGLNIEKLYLDPGARSRFEQDIERSGSVMDYEVKLRKKDGTEIDCLVTSTVWQATEGSILGYQGIIRDMTERKQTEEVLREMNIALANAMPGISRLDPEGRYVNVNEIYARMIGYEPGEMIGRDWAPTVHPKDRGNAIAAYQRMVNEGNAEFEARVVRKDGSVFHKHVLMVKRVSKEGNFIGHDCFMRDISERKRAEEIRHELYRASLEIQTPLELQERLDRFLQTAQAVLELDRVNILLADPEGRWLQAVASLGTAEPLAAIRVPIGPEGGGLAQAYLTRQAIIWQGKGPVPEDLRLKPPYDRIEAFCSQVFTIVPLVVEGRAIGVLGADRKHTRRPLDAATGELLQLFAAQAALAIEQARLYEQAQGLALRFEGLARVAHIIAATLDLKQVCDTIVQAGATLFPGGVATVWILEDETWLVRVADAGAAQPAHPERRARIKVGEWVVGWIAQIRQPLVVPDVQAEPRFPAQGWYRAEGLHSYAGLPLLFSGRCLGVLRVIRRSSVPFAKEELTLLQGFADQAAVAVQNAQLYGDLKLAALQLEATVEARTRELQVANVRLQKATRQAEGASRHKSEFLANMSHELRTPLNSILGFSEVLQRQAYGPLTEKQDRYVHNIHLSGQHLLALINDLLDLSKVEAGKIELRLEAFELREALTAALGEIRLQSEAKRLHLELQVDPALTTLTADPVRFKQILLNLLSNAVKFTPESGAVTVTAKRVRREGEIPSQLTPRARDAAELIEIAVTDTGIGIKAEDLPRLFQPFTQLESPFVKRYQGSGLGLALTKRLVELHGGTIWAESLGEAKGSRFTVLLPRAGPREIPRLLLVEDEEALAATLLDGLQAAGYQVEMARDGATALAQVATARPDLVILDLRLPTVDGWEVLRQLRADPGTRSLPVLTITGVDVELAEEALTAGADEFLTKPFSLTVLESTIGRLLREGRRVGRSGARRSGDRVTRL